MTLTRNLHYIDVVARLILGVGFTYIGFIDTSIILNDIVRIMVGIFGLVNIFAGLTRHCPVYSLAGVNTFNCASKQH